MLYLYLDDNHIKLLYLKKSILGQYEASFFEKKHDADLLRKGKVQNVDVLASALKEALTILNINEKQVFLILPQESFSFFKADVPKDITDSAINSFVQDKARSALPTATQNYYHDYFVKEVNNQKQVNFFAIELGTLDGFLEVFNLLGLKLASVLPESLAIFKLFEKTLRAEKKENILYVSYNKDEVVSYLFDSGGLISQERWAKKIASDEKLEEVLKQKKEELEEKGTKLNRIILSGEGSDTIRQDTFTKAVGVWTNPLKRIIPNFYESYLKMLVVPNQTFPLLTYDVCFGAFVFAQENKDFQMLKKSIGPSGAKAKFALPRIPLFRREVLIALISAVVSFLLVIGFSRLNLNIKDFKLPALTFNQPSPTPTPEPTEEPTPTPSVKKEEVKIKVLNGSGAEGVASEIKTALTRKGYQEILTGNADNFDYSRSVIQVKKANKDLGDLIKKDLEDSIADPKVETTLAEDETSDVIVIVGSDFK